MILSTQHELRLHIPSHAIDEASLFSGIIDNSEKDFLRDKLGNALYDRLCAYYSTIDPVAFCDNVINGTYTTDPWAELLLNAQRMVCNDALARFAYQQVISVNGSGVNVVSGNDYGNADDRLLDKGVGGYKKEAAIACNNLLILLEEWAKSIPAPDASASDEADGVSTLSSAIAEIIALWKQSKYFYLHADLLIPTAYVLQHYLDIYENRDRFIRLLPDLRFIQDEYIEDAFGEDFVKEMLTASQKATVPEESSSGSTIRLLRKTRRLITAYLEQRTTVLTIDKVRRQQAHDEAVSLKEQILAIIKAKKQSSTDAAETTVPEESSSGKGYKNNTEGSRIFVSPLLF